MKRNMKLTIKREALLRERYSSIVKEVKRCYAGNRDFDDLLQIALINYVVSLANADLKLNYHAYCMRAAHWACYKELRKTKGILSNESFLEDLQSVLDYDNSLSSVFYNNSTENDVTFDNWLSKVVELHSNLKPKERSVVDDFVLGNKNEVIHDIKIRRKQMIAKAFKDGVKEMLSAA